MSKTIKNFGLDVYPLSINDSHRIRKSQNVQHFRDGDVMELFHCRECFTKFESRVLPVTMTCGHSICIMCVDKFNDSSYTCKFKDCNAKNMIKEDTVSINYTLNKVVDQINTDVYLRIKIYDVFNARGSEDLAPEDEERTANALGDMDIRAKQKILELEFCKMILALSSAELKKLPKTFYKGSAEAKTSFENCIKKIDLSNISRATSDLRYELQPVESSLSELRSTLNTKLCSTLQDSQKKFLKQFNREIELYFDLRVIQELHSKGYVMSTKICKRSSNLWSKMEWLELGLHLHCFESNKPANSKFYFEYKAILGRKAITPRYVWFDMLCAVPANLSEGYHGLCSFNFMEAHSTAKDSVIIPYDEIMARHALVESPKKMDKSDTAKKADSTPAKNAESSTAKNAESSTPGKKAITTPGKKAIITPGKKAITTPGKKVTPAKKFPKSGIVAEVGSTSEASKAESSVATISAPEVLPDASDSNLDVKSLPTHIKVPGWRQRVYVELAETCHANHFVELAMGRDGFSYKGMELTVFKPGAILISKSVGPSQRDINYTSPHSDPNLIDENIGFVSACTPDMTSGMFQIILNNSTKCKSSFIGKIYTGIDFLKRITAVATIEDCGVVLNCPKEEF